MKIKIGGENTSKSCPVSGRIKSHLQTDLVTIKVTIKSLTKAKQFTKTLQYSQTYSETICLFTWHKGWPNKCNAFEEITHQFV